MEVLAVHRIIEQHAATRGDAPAIVCSADVATYRELNFRANAIARHLIDAGFSRGHHAAITIGPGLELAAVLLAVLKAGGAYTWLRSTMRPSWQVAVAGSCDQSYSSHHPVDLTPVLVQPPRPGPNLPILTRPSDIACVLAEESGAPFVMVPHATIAALPRPAVAAGPQRWQGDPSTFDLWTGLMAGATLSVEPALALMNAA
jgi:non-ribosomal peptide synthetase component F